MREEFKPTILENLTPEEYQAIEILNKLPKEVLVEGSIALFKFLANNQSREEIVAFYVRTLQYIYAKYQMHNAHKN